MRVLLPWAGLISVECSRSGSVEGFSYITVGSAPPGDRIMGTESCKTPVETVVLNHLAEPISHPY